MKARCIDDGGYKLTIGKIYNVKSEVEDMFYVRNDANKLVGIFKTRFEIIKEENKVDTKYMIFTFKNGITTDSITTHNAIEAIEFIKSKDDAHKATKYIQENFENAVFDIQPDGNSVKIKVTIGDYVLTN